MIPLPTQPKIVDKKQNKVTFLIEGLYPGYGVTIGNALRRVLLSSLEGAAITQMKIKGVRHEFSTIPGVMEDAIAIMLNLKQLRFKIFGDEPQKAVLLVKGQKEAKASDFKLPTQVELANKDAVVAHLTDKKAELEIEIEIEKGTGYEPAERRKKGKLEIGAVALDVAFSPVKRVSFKSENMRVGERTDFDRLLVEVETDGTISPEGAFAKGCDILLKHFSLLQEGVRDEDVKEKAKAAPKAEKMAGRKTNAKLEKEKKRKPKTKTKK